MAGIEPASERFAPRKSTSVAGWSLSRRAPQLARTTLSQPLVFRACSGVARGTPRLSRPGLLLAEIGAGGRGLI